MLVEFVTVWGGLCRADQINMQACMSLLTLPIKVVHLVHISKDGYLYVYPYFVVSFVASFVSIKGSLINNHLVMENVTMDAQTDRQTLQYAKRAMGRVTLLMSHIEDT